MSSSKRVMLVHFYDKFWMDISVQLAEQGININCIVTNHADFYKSQALFKDTKIISDISIEKAKNIRLLEQQEYDIALSEELLKGLAWEENVFLSITDRLSLYPISVHERKKLYQTLLKFWLKVVSENKIEVIIFPRTPHMGAENVLYGVAKMMKLKILYVERTGIDNHVIIKDKGFEIYDKVKNLNYTTQQIIGKIGPELMNKLYKPNAWVNISKKINEEVILGRSNIKIGKLVLSKFIKILPLISFLFSETEDSQFFYNSKKNILVVISSFFYNFQYKKQKQFYEEHIGEIDLKKKYVYFPLHYQVERSTLPLGGVFENQLLALDILAKSIPKDWVIYIKEHPRQFQYWDLRKKHFRNIDDYRRMLQYKNVRLVSIKYDSDKIIRNAKSVVTITGSSGWEGLIYKVPCIVFGYPWYIPCESCFRVTSVEQCKKALSKIKNMTPDIVERALLQFILDYKDKFVVSSNDYNYAIKSNIKYNILVENMVFGLISMINNGKE